MTLTREPAKGDRIVEIYEIGDLPVDHRYSAHTPVIRKTECWLGDCCSFEDGDEVINGRCIERNHKSSMYSDGSPVVLEIKTLIWYGNSRFNGEALARLSYYADSVESDRRVLHGALENSGFLKVDRERDFHFD